MKRVKRLFGWLLHKVARAFEYLKKEYYKSQLSACGSDVYLGNNGIATYNNISIGNHVYVGSNYVFQSAHGKIIIGNHVMFGPGVHIHGGDHIYTECGKYMDTIEKAPNSDPTVYIEDDVWIGANAIIVGGVRVAFGSVIGAGAIVTHDTEPCGIYAGVPAKLIGKRFDEDKIEEHKRRLFDVER